MPTQASAAVEVAHIHFTTNRRLQYRLKVVAASERTTVGELLTKLATPEVDRLFESLGRPPQPPKKGGGK